MWLSYLFLFISWTGVGFVGEGGVRVRVRGIWEAYKAVFGHVDLVLQMFIFMIYRVLGRVECDA